MAILDRLLEANENVLWKGRPEKRAFVLPAFASIPFGIFFIGFSIFWRALNTTRKNMAFPR